MRLSGDLANAATSSAEPEPPTVAILAWGDLFRDWLDALGVSLDEFRDEFTGSWMFGYARALETAGVRSVIVGVSERVRRPERHVHRPTRTPIHLLPAAPPFRLLRRALLDGSLAGRRDPVSIARAVLTHVSPYLATPPIDLARVLRDERCTAVLSQEYETPRFDVCTALGRILGVPVFGTFQGGDYQLSRVERALRPLALRAAAGFVVGTQSERRRLRERYGVPERKMRRIFNPVDPVFWQADDRTEARKAEGVAAEAEVVLWHGQVHPRKGLDILLEAWGRVCKERPDRPLELILVGGRRGSDHLRSEGARLHLRGVRILDDWILDPNRTRRLLSTGDLYAFPSRHEGFPVAPLEAMACGLPVISTDAQGLPDIFEHGEDDGGIVVPSEDAEAFATALGAVLDDTPRRKTLARNARRRIETAFALETVGVELAAFLTGRDEPGPGADVA